MCGKDQECFIIGAASIYRQFMPLADKLNIISGLQPEAYADDFRARGDAPGYVITAFQADFCLDDSAYSANFFLVW